MDIEFWIGLLGGAVLGFITNWIFHLFNKEENWNEQFKMDKQILNRFLEKVKFEIELIIEQIRDHDQNEDSELKFENILYFRRLLNEDPFTLSFGDKNFNNTELKPVRVARDLIDTLKETVKKGEFNKAKLIKVSSDLTKIRMAIISIKV